MKKHIAVVMGGTTSEHAISLKSGQTVLNHLPKEHFNVTAVVVSPQGYVAQHQGEQLPIELSTFSFSHKGKTIAFDAVFNAVHGAPGENGELQSILDGARISYTGCTAEVARLTYNKYDTLEF
ncbi:MAG: D-alanine--D-alanine ligase, partial [Flavobacteriaceae bacterium]